MRTSLDNLAALRDALGNLLCSPDPADPETGTLARIEDELNAEWVTHPDDGLRDYVAPMLQRFVGLERLRAQMLATVVDEVAAIAEAVDARLTAVEERAARGCRSLEEIMVEMEEEERARRVEGAEELFGFAAEMARVHGASYGA